DRPAGAAAGFAVVGKAVLLADPVGPAVVRGLRVGHLVQEGQRLLRRVHRAGVDEETALADFEQVFGPARQGLGGAHFSRSARSAGSGRSGCSRRSSARLARAPASSPMSRRMRMRSIQSSGASRRSSPTGGRAGGGAAGATIGGGGGAGTGSTMSTGEGSSK